MSPKNAFALSKFYEKLKRFQRADSADQVNDEIAEFLDGNRADDFIARNEFKAQQHNVEMAERRLERLKVELKRIENHCRRLSILKNNSMRKLLTNFDNSDLKEKLQRALDLFDGYKTIQVMLESYKHVIEEELPRVKEKSSKLFAKEIGAVIRAARNKKGLTQVALAEMLSINRATLIFYEQGVREPSIYNLRRIAIALDIPPNELLGVYLETSTS